MATTKTARNAIIYINDEKAQVTKAFEKKACVFGTEEFKLWREYKAMFPKAQMVTKKIKKNENQKKRRNRTYENMEEYIKTLADEAIEAEFKTIKKRSKIQTSPYQFVLDWFEERFKGYDDMEAFMSQKEEERKQKEEEAAAEKAAQAAADKKEAVASVEQNN